MDLRRLQMLSGAVTKAIRQDDKGYFTQLLANMGDPTDQAVTTSTWKAIRWALPKVRQKHKQSPLLLATLDDQWHQHFATLEAGETLTSNRLQQCDQRQRARKRGGRVDLHDLPTLVEVEASLRGIEPHKAPGPDRISNAVYKYGAPDVSKVVHDIFVKSVVWEMEPLQNKGGLMFPIHKSGSLSVAKNYRGIMLLNTMGKCFHSILRRRVPHTPANGVTTGRLWTPASTIRCPVYADHWKFLGYEGIIDGSPLVDVRGAYTIILFGNWC